ncbi:protein-L-isoaspartate O-methyltransferase-like protein [Myxozyma melibiosi]|uniref:protein-L-isoaspartate(D-aspartate) O-methyltransferase n=1 Tax=Myxozyma melibiosi TaxID=54550 RepID=A0ABR1FCA8_9ASCO
MAWRCSASTNAKLVDNLAAAQLLSTSRVIDAFKATDRGLFSPRRPYEDAPQYLGYGATISAPHMHAVAVESLHEYLYPGAAALDIGSGSGYLLAVMAKLVMPGGKVCGIEHIRELNDAAVERFLSSEGEQGNSWIKNGDVVFWTGDGRKGWPDPEIKFDAIHVGAAIPVVPESLISHLKSPGKMFIPVGEAGDTQHIYEIVKDSAGVVTHNRKFGVSYVPLADAEYYYSKGDNPLVT